MAETTARKDRSVDALLRTLGPTTVVTAALYYFGWVRTRAIAQHFGIEPELLGYTPTDYVLRSVDTSLFVLVLGAVIVLLWRWWLATSLRRRRADLDDVRAFGGRIGRIGLAMLPFGLFALIYFSQFESTLLAVAGLVVALASVALSTTGARLRTVRFVSGTGAEYRCERLPVAQRVAYDVLGVAALFGLVFLTASWLGTAIAQARVDGLDEEASVVLTSQNELHLFQTLEGTPLTDHGVKSDPWRFRYPDLKLFAESNDRWFLIPADWPDNRVVHVVSVDETVRLDIDQRGP